MKKFFKRAAFFIGVPALIAFIFFFIAGLGMEQTSTVNFCGSCHSMKPMLESYKKDVHAGHNPMGLIATCTDCHLPHDGLIHHLAVKTKTGLKDLYVEHFGEPEKVNWKLKWVKRADFVYDSGCIKCHNNFDPIDRANPDAAHAHKFYRKEKKHTCVLCHRHIGHKDVSKIKPNK